MSQVKPGGGESGRPGNQPRKAAPTRRPAAKTPAAKTTAKGRPPTAGGAKGGSGRPPGGPKGAGQRGPSGKGAARPNKTIAARPPQRFSPSTMAFVAVGLVVVIILVFVVIKITGGSSKNNTNTAAPTLSPAPASLVGEVTGVPASIVNTVGTGSGVIAPTVLSGQPALTSGGHPEVLFIGAEFCPYCAAERWAMINAFSRFGTWSGLNETTSSPWDSPPAISTFSFVDAKLSSQYLTFVPVEHETNDTSGLDTRKALEPLTTAQGNLWTNYSSKLGLQGTGYPFVDFGNKVFVTGPSYNPATILAGLSQNEIAGKLANASDPVTQAIVGTANYLTAAVCSLTHDQPAAVCSAAGVKKAAGAMNLS